MASRIMTSYHGPERRVSARLVESFQFKIDVDGYDLTATTVNLSTSGLLCRVNRDIPCMTKIKLLVMLPTASNKSLKFSAEGVVVRSDEDEAGFLVAIFFSEIKDKARRLIEKYIEDRTSR